MFLYMGINELYQNKMELVTYLHVLIFIAITHVALSAEPFIEQPPDSLATTKGDTVTLRCGIGGHITATLFWQDMMSGDVITKRPVVDPELNFPLEMRKRYSINGNIEIGEYHLQIRNVKGVDEGQYACFYYDEGLQTEQQSNIVTLAVMLPPTKGYPMCSMEPELNQPGDTVTMTCESRGGKPAAALTWIREQDILEGTKYTPNQEISYSRQSIFLTEDDVDVRFLCIARTPATKELPGCSLKPIRTSIDAEIAPSSLEVRPGESAVFTCISEDLPKLEYFWYVNTIPVDDNQERFKIKRKGKRFIVDPSFPTDDLSLVTCVVEQYGPYKTVTASASAILRVDRSIYTKTASIPTIDIDFSNDDENNVESTTMFPTTEESITSTDYLETSAPPTPSTVDIKSATVLSKPDLPVSEKPHGDAQCRGDTCISSTKPKVTTGLTTLLLSSTTRERSTSSNAMDSSGKTSSNITNCISSTKMILKTIATKAPLSTHKDSHIITDPPTKSNSNPAQSLNKSNSILCWDGACAAIVSGNVTGAITINSSTEKPGVSMVTPPNEEGQQPGSNGPVEQRDAVMPVMLTLALICLIVVIIFIVLVIMRKRRSPDPKAEDKENPIPVVNRKYPSKSPAQGRAGLKNQNKYSKTCTSFSSLF